MPSYQPYVSQSIFVASSWDMDQYKISFAVSALLSVRLFTGYANIIVTYTLPVTLTSIGLSGAFSIYDVACVLSLIFVYVKVPEAKGMPLEVITEFFALGARPGSAEKDTQPTATPHLYPEDPGTASEGAARSPELSFGARRRGLHPWVSHTLVRDARNVIELNQYKYTNVPVVEEHMANLTSHELAEAIRLYRDEQARARIEYEQDDE
ncbi:hypothetical protein AgCh_038258 [Apium graveolens]